MERASSRGGPRRHVVLVNRYFHPDISATSQIASELMGALSDRGHDVEVVTSRQLYEDAAARLAAHEDWRGVTIRRVWTTTFGRATLVGRLADYVSFYVAAAFAVWSLARRGSVVIAKTDPPLLCLVTTPAAILRGAHHVNWLQDLFPEVAERLGVGGLPVRLASPLLKWLRGRSLRRSAGNVVIGQRMRDVLLKAGAPHEGLEAIPNWSDGRIVAPVAAQHNALRRDWGLENVFVVGYSGNLGRAHDIETLLTAMEACEGREDLDVSWLFVGGGHQHARLSEEVARRGLGGVLFKPYQPRDNLSASLGVADVHLVSLRPELEGLIVPSKFYGIAAAGRAAIFIGDEDGEIGRELSRSGCGVCVRSGDGAGLAEAVVKFARDRDATDRMGRAARAAFERDFDLPVAVERWERLLARVGGRQVN